MTTCRRLDRMAVERIVRSALEEDLGQMGDITSRSVVPAGTLARGTVVARNGGIVAGPAIAGMVFETLDPRLEVEILRPCGEPVGAGEVILAVEGEARSILAAERTALNLLGRLSGIATLTRRFVEAVAGTGAVITDTRKTTPGLRVLERAAVAAGGGRNHRFGLFDAVLIKDNHLAVAGSVRGAVQRARSAVGHTVKVEVEVETLEQLAEALEAGADIVLLDNMDLTTLARAGAMAKGHALTEASGGITLENVRAVAETGVDLISVGALTHSAPALDVSLEMERA